MGRHFLCSANGRAQSEEPHDSPSVIPWALHTQWALGLVLGLIWSTQSSELGPPILVILHNLILEG